MCCTKLVGSYITIHVSQVQTSLTVSGINALVVIEIMASYAVHEALHSESQSYASSSAEPDALSKPAKMPMISHRLQP